MVLDLPPIFKDLPLLICLLTKILRRGVRRKCKAKGLKIINPSTLTNPNRLAIIPGLHLLPNKLNGIQTGFMEG